MRRSLAIALLVCAALPAASADAHRPTPGTHGPDPVTIDRLPELPPPAGGPSGRQLKPTYREEAEPSVVRSSLPSAWCGTELAADDREHEYDNGDYRFHAVYALASDAASRFTALATTIQTDALQASALIEREYGRALRYDLGTVCGPQFLDISVLRLPQTTVELQQLAATETGLIETVSKELDRAGFPVASANQRPPMRNWVVWLDGPAPAGTCGQATLYDDRTRAASNASNSSGNVSMIFSRGNGFCGSNTVRHEIAHNLGALQPPAPHAYDGAHCNDAYEDTMCGVSSPRVADGSYHGLYFDYRNDDYWDPPGGASLPWWTVNLNRYVCADAVCNVPPGGDAPPLTDPGTSPPPSPTANCPPGSEPQPDVEGDDCQHQQRRRAAKASVRVRAVKRGGRRYRMTARVRGEGRGVLTARCRKHRHGRIRVVLKRRIALPKTVRKTLPCRTKPRVKLYQAAAPAND
jgi:hypothetical protein